MFQQIKAALGWVGVPFALLLLWLGVILFISSQSRVPQLPGEGILGAFHVNRATVGHLSLYGVLGVLALWSAGRARPKWGWSLLGIVAAGVFGFLWGSLDEWYQGFVPGRVPTLGDVGLDTAGAFGGSGLLYLLHSLLHRPVFARRK